MAMVKIVSPSGWDFDCEIAHTVKIASDGLRGNDRKDFIKRAAGSENVFLPLLDGVKFAEDEEPVHLIALGASEGYGANRNGDGFKEAACKKYHDTFVKFARFYRNHKNKDPKISYGTIKASAYNPVMRRVELLAALNKTASAAERNGGFIADRELQKLASGKDLSVSMACRVPFDLCSWCGHQARTREEYCKEASCGGGGCAKNLTKLIKTAQDVHLLHVDNPNPTWFDMSDVFRPADRIAYAGKADWLQKAASDNGFFGIDGAKMATDLGVMAPLSVILYQDTMQPMEWGPYIDVQIKLAHAIHLLEKQGADLPEDCRRAFAADMQPDMDLAAFGLDTTHPVKCAAALGALVDQKIILSLRDFGRMTKRSELIDDAAACLRGVYGRMIADGSLERSITANAYAPSEKLATGAQREKAAQYRSHYTLDFADVQNRCLRSSLRGYQIPSHKSAFWNEKKAHDSPLAETLARDYGLYKLACLRRIAQFDTDFPLTVRTALTQNSVI
jgi:hypothetical protein